MSNGRGLVAAIHHAKEEKKERVCVKIIAS